jgi:hypothetical protein
MKPQFFYHESSSEPRHTFIQLPSTAAATFGGWGPKF